MDNFRSIDGTANNLNHSEYGQLDGHLLRVADADYGDGVSTLAGGSRANAREVSNALMDQQTTSGNSDNMSNFLWMWGQFLAHDISITETAEPHESANVQVTAGDAHFDPTGTGTAEMEFNRSAYDPATGITGPREQINQITAWLDASQVYGSTLAVQQALRADGGKMKVSDGDLLPFNDASPADQQPGGVKQFLAGDVRVNENVTLTSTHTLFVREHNRLVDELSKKNKNWDAERLFQEARVIVEAELQAITYNEFLPHLLGKNAMSDWTGYNSGVDPRVTNEFSTAAFRIGHTLLSPEIPRLKNNGDESEFGHLALRDAFFRPDRLVNEGGIDDILRGAGTQQSETLDSQLIDEVRNFLFGQPGAGGFDLGAFNVQRGRDHGLNDYNSVREATGLKKATSFADITSDATLQKQLQDLYGSVDEIDLYVGGLMEDPVKGSLLGELFQTLIVDQFTRLRDGDRFWFENRMTPDQIREIEATKFSDIIERNSNVKDIQDDVFVSYNRNIGTTEDDIIIGEGDRDLILGFQGNDILMGGDEHQQIVGGGGEDALYGGAGSDNLYGGADDDVIHGGTGRDKISGDNGDDFIMGDAGDDRIDGAKGNDMMVGGNGNDTFVFSKGDDVILDFNTTLDVLDFSDSKTVASELDLIIQSFTGGTLVEDRKGNTLWLDDVSSFSDVKASYNGDSAPAEQVFIQGDRSAVLRGTRGDDHFLDTEGTQYVLGRGGQDTMHFSGKSTDYEITRTDDRSGFVVASDDGFDILWGIESLAFDDIEVPLIIIE